MKKFGLSQQERIKSEKDFKLIYSSGKILISDDQKLKAHYFVVHGQSQPLIKIAPAVSRKAGHAVWRNRLKRLIRESYRLNKYVLAEECIRKECSLLIVFSPYSVNMKKKKDVALTDIMPAVLSIMQKIVKVL